MRKSVGNLVASQDPTMRLYRWYNQSPSRSLIPETVPAGCHRLGNIPPLGTPSPTGPRVACFDLSGRQHPPAQVWFAYLLRNDRFPWVAQFPQYHFTPIEGEGCRERRTELRDTALGAVEGDLFAKGQSGMLRAPTRRLHCRPVPPAKFNETDRANRLGAQISK